MADFHEVFGGTERKQRACRRVIEGSLLVHDMTEDQLPDLPADVACSDGEESLMCITKKRLSCPYKATGVPT